MAGLRHDPSLQQVANVAHLAGHPQATPGDARHPLGLRLPHRRRGGDRRRSEGVISPGGVGYDINCGVRLLRSDLIARRRRGPDLRELVDQLFRDIPTGVGAGRRELPVRHAGARRACWTRARPRRSIAGLRAPTRDLDVHRGRAAACRGPIPTQVSDRAPASAAATSSARSARATTSSRSRSSTAISTRRPPRRSGSARGQVTVLIHSRLARPRPPGLRRLPAT